MKITRVSLALGAIAFGLGAFTSACSSGTSSGDKTATAAAGVAPTKTPPRAAVTAAPTQAAASTTSTTSGGVAVAVSIEAKDFSFTSDKDSANKGDKLQITFKNSGAATHTLTFYSDDAYTKKIGGADSGRVPGGGAAMVSVTAPGDGSGLYYRCEVHPTQMKGEIEVQ